MPFKKKKRKRFNRAFEDDSNPEFQVAPMADLLFVLLVFFMSITTVEVLSTEKGLNLPVAHDSKENKQKSHQVVVNVHWNDQNHIGTLRVEERNYKTPEDLVGMLQSRLSKDPILRVVIRADKDAEYLYISQIMKACSEANIPNVTFAVLNKEPKANIVPVGS